MNDKKKPIEEQGTDKAPNAAAEDSEVQALKEALQEKEQKAAEYLGDVQRIKAEFENYKKRVAKDQVTFTEIANAALVEKLLSILDNFELGLSKAEEHRETALLKGMEMVYAELREALKKEGLQEVESLDQPFNPELHEAVMTVPSEEHEDGTVIDVLRKGYTYRSRLLRPAMVKISRKP